MIINAHLGAHKTATTHLQRMLLANRERLKAQNISLSTPRDLRQGWLRTLRKISDASKKSNIQTCDFEKLRAIVPSEGLLILSEENIIGVPNDFASKPGFYPLAGRRVESLVDVFKNDHVNVFFSLRSYDGFYSSLYTEVVRNKGYLPFSDFYREAHFKNYSWVEMVRSFQRALPQENIILWKFEEFRALLPQILRLMTGLEDVDELIHTYTPQTTRSSLSSKTIKILDKLHPVLTKNVQLSLIKFFNRVYPVDEANQPYRPFNSLQTDKFIDRYEQDVEMIKKSFPGVRFLTP